MDNKSKVKGTTETDNSCEPNEGHMTVMKDLYRCLECSGVMFPNFHAMLDCFAKFAYDDEYFYVQLNDATKCSSTGYADLHETMFFAESFIDSAAGKYLIYKRGMDLMSLHGATKDLPRVVVSVQSLDDYKQDDADAEPKSMDFRAGVPAYAIRAKLIPMCFDDALSYAYKGQYIICPSSERDKSKFRSATGILEFVEVREGRDIFKALKDVQFVGNLYYVVDEFDGVNLNNLQYPNNLA